MQWTAITIAVACLMMVMVLDKRHQSSSTSSTHILTVEKYFEFNSFSNATDAEFDSIINGQRQRVWKLAKEFSKRGLFTPDEASRQFDLLMEGYRNGTPRLNPQNKQRRDILMAHPFNDYKSVGSLTAGQLLQMKKWRAADDAAFAGQLTKTGYLYFADLMTEICPCDMLIFSVGRDSLVYPTANPLGRTHYIEDNAQWLSLVKDNFKERAGNWSNATLDFTVVNYTTKFEHGFEYMGNDSALRMTDLPESITGRNWDIIFVDGPLGFKAGNPGRMQSIYMAAALAWRAIRTKQLSMVHVFVHDTERTLERLYGNAYLNDANMILRAAPSLLGQLSHYVITADSFPPRFTAEL